MQLQNFYAQDANGNTMPLATGTLYLPGSTTLATGLQDVNGEPLSNPFSADTKGLISIAAPNGYYDLVIDAGTRTGRLRVMFIDVDQVAEDAASASDSAQASEYAAVVAISRTARFLAPSATDPVIRDDGTPLQIGDRYVNTATQAEYIYKTEGWALNDSLEAIAEIKDPANLDKGAALIPYDGTNVGEQILKGRKVVGYSDVRSYTGAASNFEITDPLLHGFFYVDLSDTTSPDNGGTTLIDGSGRRIKRQIDGPIQSVWFGVKTGNVSNAQALTNSQAINAALDFVGLDGGGAVELPHGTLLLTNTNPSPVNWDNRYSIFMRYNGTTLKGKGRGNTILKMVAGSNCHAIKVGSTEAVIRPNNCQILNLEIDGDRANQTTPTPTVDHFNGIAVSGWCVGTVLGNLYIHDTPYYGAGIGREGLDNCTVWNVETNNTGADGLDWKNDSDTQVGGIVNHFTARNFGLLPLSNVQTAQAGLDLRSGIRATNVNISDMNGESGLVGIRLQNGSEAVSSVAASQPSTVDHFRVKGVGATNSIGLRVISRGSSAENGNVNNCSDGYSFSNLDCRYSALIAEANSVGFRLWSAGSGTAANTNTLNGLVARSNTQAGVVCDTVTENDFIGCDVRNNGIGYDIRSGSAASRIIGGSCSGNTTNLSDLGTGTVVTTVSGLRTSQKVTGNVALGSTGLKVITINHTLGVTPVMADVQISLGLHPSYNVEDFAVSFMRVADVSATTVTVHVKVLTASATAGALAIILASINSKSAI